MSDVAAPVRVDRDGRGVATLTLDRADVRNALDDRLIDAATVAARRLAGDRDVRVVVLAGAGPTFCAGADIAWMRSAARFTHQENVASTRAVDALLRSLYDLPQPLVARVLGGALGGGTGLVAVADVAVAARDARFGFTEVRLGIAPAVISPYVVRAIGRSHARALFVTGERFDAAHAHTIGLVHRVVDADALDGAVAAVVDACLRGAPGAIAAAKDLVDAALDPLDVATGRTPGITARLRAAPEGQEGLGAFVERRAPSWAPTDPRP